MDAYTEPGPCSVVRDRFLRQWHNTAEHDGRGEWRLDGRGEALSWRHVYEQGPLDSVLVFRGRLAVPSDIAGHRD